MRTIDPALLATLVRHFSHGAITHYDPERELGTQRESFRGLGFGSIYAGLADIAAAEKILVVGSGRGFAVACFALAVEERSQARVWFVDPGYSEWSVEGGVVDSAPGMWRDPATSREHFARHLGLRNIDCLAVTSDEAFAAFRDRSLAFDLILVDGSHSYHQAARDLDNALSCLAPRGLVLAHDTSAPEWSGPVLALDALLAARLDLQAVTLPFFPGLSLLQRKPWPLEIRPASAEENARVNRWRAEAGVAERPLADGDDPRPGERGGDPREALYAVLDAGELIGGFGLRHRRFSGGGPDDFFPYEAGDAAGLLLYGLVLRPDQQGRGRWRLIKAWVVGELCPEGFYSLSTFPAQGRPPFVVRRVGSVGPFTAFHSRLPPRGALPPGLEEISRQLRRSADAARAELEACRIELARAQREASALRSSTSWRLTAPVRRLLDLLRSRRR